MSIDEAPPWVGMAERRPDRGPAGTPGRARAERLLLWASAVVAMAAPAVAALDVAVPGRTVLALAFLLLVPGVPLAALLRVPDRLLAGSLAVGLSLATALLTATLTLTLGAWNPVVTASVTGEVSLGLTWLALTRLPAARPRTARVRDQVGGPGRPAGGNRARTAHRLGCLALLALALGLWTAATRQVDLDAAGAAGVIGVVPAGYVAAVLIVAAVAGHLLLRRVLDGWLLTATVVVLVVVVFAFVNVADGAASVPTGWLHVGYARFITDHGATFTGLDARAQWPGFFAVAAQLVRMSGVPDASAFLSWAPVAFDLAAVAPLLVVARAVTRSPRLAWLSVFVYLAADWFQQDYFAPQAAAFLLYLVVLATLLWSGSTAPVPPAPGSPVRRAMGAWRRRPELPAGTTAAQSLGREGALLVLSAAVVVSHQLTPITLVITLAVFAATGWTRHRRLWLVVVLLFAAWFAYGATPFWLGHLGGVLGDVGKVGSNFDSAVADRSGVDAAYQTMQTARLAWSGLYAVGAGLGLWTIRRRPDALLIGLVAAGAGGLVLVQSYGGEVVIRSFVLAAPLLAPLNALALGALARRLAAALARPAPASVSLRPGSLRSRPAPPPTRVVRAVLACVLAAALGGSGLVVTATRGVNVSFERVTPDDVAAARVLARDARPGETVGVLEQTGALGSDLIGTNPGLVMSEAGCGMSPVECARARRPAFVVVSRSQAAMGRLQEGRPAGWASQVLDQLVDEGLYERVYTGPEASVLRLVGIRVGG